MTCMHAGRQASRQIADPQRRRCARPLTQAISIDLHALHPLHPPHIIAHPPHAELLAELAPRALGAVPDRLLQLLAVPRAIFPLDELHVRPVPVVAHEAGDEQLGAQGVGFRERQGVVEEEGVADGPVDDAVEDVS